MPWAGEIDTHTRVGDRASHCASLPTFATPYGAGAFSDRVGRQSHKRDASPGKRQQPIRDRSGTAPASDPVCLWPVSRVVLVIRVRCSAYPAEFLNPTGFYWASQAELSTVSSYVAPGFTMPQLSIQL
jgi:hypothetical protein